MRTAHGSVSPGDLVGASVGDQFPTAYTPAITWPGNTITTVAATFVHQPGVLLVWGSFTETVGTANAVLTIPLPAGFTVALPGGAAGTFCGVLMFSTAEWANFGVTNAATSVVTPSLAGIVSSSWNFEFYVPVTT